MIPLAMIMLDELRDDLPEVPRTDWNDAIETFFLDRPDEGTIREEVARRCEKALAYVVEFWRETGIASPVDQGDQLEDERRIHQHISLRREFVRDRLNESLFIEEATTEGAAALGEIHRIEDHVALAVRTRHRAAWAE